MEQCRPHREAVKLLELAVGLESGEACGLLAWALGHGRGVQVNYKRAFELAQRGHNLGDLTATAVLAYCYIRQLGVDEEDRPLGFELAKSCAHWPFATLWDVQMPQRVPLSPGSRR